MEFIKNFNQRRRISRDIRRDYDGLFSIPRIKDLQGHLKKYNATSLGIINANTLDIGCGIAPRNPFNAKTVFGIDIRSEDANHTIKNADLTIEPIPFSDNTFDYITAYDFLEHVPRIIYLPERRFAFIELMNEIWRALKYNGIFLSHTPVFPFSASFRDPTHVNIITRETFPIYFCGENPLAKMYGFYGNFVELEQVLIGAHLISILKKAPQ